MMYTSRLSGKPTPLTAVIDMVAFDSEVLESELLAMRHEREELNENAFKQIQQLCAIRQALVDIKNEHQRMVSKYEARIEDLTRQLEVQKGGSYCAEAVDPIQFLMTIHSSLPPSDTSLRNMMRCWEREATRSSNTLTLFHPIQVSCYPTGTIRWLAWKIIWFNLKAK
ncbi:hypothetical protein BT69DRAFT_680869 [Atractiella rhizophila]|nr:hypothetical protein BT69DRAFT_680869 [Atractiella rhizophila]